jgi:hypothetical protein
MRMSLGLLGNSRRVGNHRAPYSPGGSARASKRGCDRLLSSAMPGDAELFPEPRSAQQQIAPHGWKLEIQRFTNLFRLQAAEIVKFHDFQFARIPLRHACQGVVQVQDKSKARRVDGNFLLKYSLHSAVTLEPRSPPRVLHQNLSHQTRRYSEKVGPILPASHILLDHPEINLIDKGGRLERVLGALVSHQRCGRPAQFGVNRGNKLLASFCAIVVPPGQ